MQYVVRGGRLSAKKAKWAERLRLTPILGITANGGTTIAKKLFGKSNLSLRFAKFAVSQMDKSKKYKVIVTHLQALNTAKFIVSKMKSMNSAIVDIEISDSGCVIGVHSGPGSVGIAIMECDKVV